MVHDRAGSGRGRHHRRRRALTVNDDRPRRGHPPAPGTRRRHPRGRVVHARGERRLPRHRPARPARRRSRRAGRVPRCRSAATPPPRCSHRSTRPGSSWALDAVWAVTTPVGAARRPSRCRDRPPRRGHRAGARGDRPCHRAARARVALRPDGGPSRVRRAPLGRVPREPTRRSLACMRPRPRAARRLAPKRVGGRGLRSRRDQRAHRDVARCADRIRHDEPDGVVGGRLRRRGGASAGRRHIRGS